MKRSTLLFRTGTALLLLVSAAAAERAVLPLDDDDTIYVQFPVDFPFSFGGVPYKGVWVNSNGNLTFTGAEYSYDPTVPDFLGGALINGTGYPMIAPLWVDLDLSSGGALTAGRVSATEFDIHWENVPAYGTTSRSTFSVILRTDGSFRFVYGNVAAAPTTSVRAIVGFATGYPNTLGAGAPTNLSGGPFCPAARGTGVESSIFEVFTPAGGSSALSNRSICFNPVLPSSGLVSLYDDDVVEIACVSFHPVLWGNRYTSLWLNSNGNVTFGSSDWSFFYGSSFAPFLHSVGRLAPLWRDLDPSSGGSPGSAGRIQVTQTASQMLFSWVNVPTFGGTGTSSFSLAINADSSVSFSYGNMDTVVAQRALGGVTGGYPLTTGAETTVTLGSLPMPIGTGVPAVFQAFAAGPFPYANGTLSFDAAHAALSSPMPLGDEAACEVVFPTSAAFPFGGTTYGSAFFNSNGYVGLGFNTIDYPGWYYTVSDTQAFLGLFPRIAPFWIDLAPNPGGITEGSFTVQSTANSVSFSWTSVPELGPSPGANTASVTLGPSEAIVMNFGPASMTQPHTGFSTGGGKTMGTELSTNLSALSSPIGRGTDTAIFESFTMFDLANTSISFTGASRILYQDPILSPGIVRVALGAAPGDGGLGYVAALSLGSVPGIPVTGCANVPLNFDPLFVLSLSGLMLNNTGVLDGWGQKDGFPAVPPASPMVVLVPSGLAGLGLTAWMSFVTYPSGGGCVFRTIAGAVPFRIP